MKYKDYYAALDIPRDADLDQIKKAYRKLARQYHSDGATPGAQPSQLTRHSWPPVCHRAYRHCTHPERTGTGLVLGDTP